MPRNPILNVNHVDSQSIGLTHDQDAVNPVKVYRQGMNPFDGLSHERALTERYADVSPFLAMDCVERDIIPFRSIHNVRSYTMKSPAAGKVFKHKFYSLVPYRAILPNTWELIYANPTKGSDVPSDAYCSYDIINAWKAQYISMLSGTPTSMEIIEFLIATEAIFSTGSLPSYLKYGFHAYLYKDRTTNFDVFFNVIAQTIANSVVLIREVQPNVYYNVATSDAPAGAGEDVVVDRVISIRSLLDILRSGDYRGQAYVNLTAISGIWSQFTSGFMGNFDVNSWITYPVDLSRLIAYQITCVSQMTDDSIDYIFNANLFRNVFFNVLPDTFSYNARTVLYDVFSAHHINKLCTATVLEFTYFVQRLFSYAKSLKFGDYYTTSRPFPLANGDVNAQPNDDGSISALEMTRRLVYARFLNWNNRVGPSYDEYVKSLTGMNALPDPEEPASINHSVSVLSDYEVENTGAAQLTDGNSVTRLIRSNSNIYEFNIIVSEPSILLGLTSYDAKRLYTKGCERANLKEDRFDFFNHMLQYTGDQDIKACEIDATRGLDAVAYTTKDMHYKVAISDAAGGFLTSLPSWAMTFEDSDNDALEFGINPDFIRNVNSDFDRFYVSLTGYSLGTYFHFICYYDNDFTGIKRAMDVAPDIL